MTPPEDAFVAAVHARATQALPPVTRERLAQALLDWFTAGWSGMAMPLAGCVQALAARSFPARGTSPVFGAPPLVALGAGFANAAIAHLREIDDAHRTALLHPGVVAVSPVLALAAEQPLSRERIGAAIVAGYEVALRVGEALGPGHAARFHGTATAGCLGAAAAAGVALGLPADGPHHALGIAAPQSAGLWQIIDDEAHEAKSLHPGFAVRNGMMAAFASHAGLPGARAFLTGTRGLYTLLAGDGPLAALAFAPDEPERIHTATIKAWPSCAMAFTALDALQALMQEHGVQSHEVAALDIDIFPHALKIASVDWPTKAAEAPFSLKYLAATLLLAGRVGIAEMEQPRLDDPAWRALAARIRVRGPEELQRGFPAKRPARVTLRLADGRELNALRELRRGDPEDPFDWPALRARLRSFAPRIDDASAARVAAWCEAFAEPLGAPPSQPCPIDPSLFGPPATAVSSQPSF